MSVLIITVEIIWELKFSEHYLDNECEILEDSSKFTQKLITCVDYHLTALEKGSEAGEIDFLVYTPTNIGYFLLKFSISTRWKWIRLFYRE